MDERALAELIAAVQGAKKYRQIDAAIIERICREELPKHAKGKDALKAVKRKLHQATGAYSGALVPGAAQTADDSFDALLRTHASTRERLGFYEAMFADVDAVIGAPGSVLDLACGLNPLLYARYRQRQGMPLPRYAAYDIRRDTVEIVRRFFEEQGISGIAEPSDLLCGVPGERAELALLLKIVPLLERQQKGGFERVIAEIRAPRVAVSFPTRTLGGGRAGMGAQYRRFFEAYLARAEHRLLLEKEYPNELLFVFEKLAAEGKSAYNISPIAENDTAERERG